MQIRELKMRNAFQHEKLDITFQPFQAIVGQNGSGKSNIIESIGFALTGKFTLPGTNDTMIREGSDKGHIELKVEDNGDPIDIKAHLGKASRSLVRGGAHPLDVGKSSEVLEIMQGLLKAPFDLVNETSIIRQGKLTEGLFMARAGRTEMFLRMAGLAGIEKKRQQLADVKSSITVPMLSFTVEATENKIATLSENAKVLLDELDTIKKVDISQLQAARDAVTLAKKAAENVEQLSKLTKELPEHAALLNDAKAAVEQAKLQLDALTNGEESLTDGISSANEAVNLYRTNLEKWNKKEKLVKDLDYINGLLQDLGNPPSEPDIPAIDELVATEAEVSAQVAQLGKTVDAFSQEVSVCPTCRRPCTKEEAQEILVSAKEEVKTFEQLRVDVRAALNTAKEATKHYQTASKAYSTELTKLESQYDSIMESFKEVEHAAKPVEPTQAMNVLAQSKDVSTRLKAARKAYDEAVSILEDVNKVYTTTVANISALSNAGGQPLTPADIVSREQYIALCESTIARETTINAQLDMLNKSLEEETKRLESLKAEEQKAKVFNDFVSHLEFARTALHRDSFPAGKVKAFVDKMLVATNLYLDAMQAGFSATYDNEAGFMAFFPQKNKHMRADRLSGGEKVIFSLAFRFAVNELHTDTGFLILDEPTIWLDTDHIDYVINALALVKSKLVPRVQLIIVTHDEKLAAVADSVFEVKKI